MSETMHCACQFERRENPDLSGKPPVLIESCGYHSAQQRDGARLDRSMQHNWHVAINRFNEGKIGGKDFCRWMYEAKALADEVPRMVRLFRMERERKLTDTHKQCSMSAPEPVKDNHLSCCLGVECRKCPHLLALDKADMTPEEIDVAKAWTCAAHIVREGGDVMSEGYLLTVDDRMYWDNVHASLAAADADPDA